MVRGDLLLAQAHRARSTPPNHSSSRTLSSSGDLLPRQPKPRVYDGPVLPTEARRPSAKCGGPLLYRGVRVRRVCCTRPADPDTRIFVCISCVFVCKGGVRTCALTCAFWLWTFFAGPFYIRGTARICVPLECPRFPSDAKQASFEPRNWPQISEKPLQWVRGRTEGKPGISRMRQFSLTRDQSPIRTEKPRGRLGHPRNPPTRGPTGNRQGTKDAWMKGCQQEDKIKPSRMHLCGLCT